MSQDFPISDLEIRNNEKYNNYIDSINRDKNIQDELHHMYRIANQLIDVKYDQDKSKELDAEVIYLKLRSYCANHSVFTIIKLLKNS